jgi:biotin carboxylase
MKRRFVERAVPTPRFFVVNTFEDALDAWEELGQDCMVKMVDATSSMNVFRVFSRSELKSAWDRIIHDQKGTRTGFVRSPEVILEQFVGGRELTVEGYIQDDQLICLNFCEKLTEHNFIVVGHFLPAEVSEAEAQILRRTAEQCVRAVGMRNSVFHIEIHMYEDRPYVIECASRPPGRHMVELMHRAYGYDLMGISIALATREPVHEAPREPKLHFAMLAIYSPRRGTLEHVAGLEELKRRGGVAHVNIEAKPGDPIDVLTTFHQKYGFIILEDETAAGIREKADWMRRNVQLVLAGDSEQGVNPRAAGG